MWSNANNKEILEIFATACLRIVKYAYYPAIFINATLYKSTQKKWKWRTRNDNFLYHSIEWRREQMFVLQFTIKSDWIFWNIAKFQAIQCDQHVCVFIKSVSRKHKQNTVLDIEQEWIAKFSYV